MKSESKQYWIGTVITLCIAGAFLGWPALDWHLKRHYAPSIVDEVRACEYLRNENQNGDDGMLGVVPGKVESAPDQKQSCTEQYYAAQDLNQQRTMAFWTFIMGLMTSIGVILLWRTLNASNETLKQAELTTDAANRATDATKKIGDEQLRARISITKLTIDPFINSSGPGIGRLYEVDALIEVHNSGILPATSVVGEVYCSVAPNGNDFQPYGSKRIVFFDIVKDRPTVIFDDRFKLTTQRINLSTNSAVVISGQISYLTGVVTSDAQSNVRVSHMDTLNIGFRFGWNTRSGKFEITDTDQNYRH